MPPGCYRCCHHSPYQRGACRRRKPAAPAMLLAGEAGKALSRSCREAHAAALAAGRPQGTACRDNDLSNLQLQASKAQFLVT